MKQNFSAPLVSDLELGKLIMIHQEIYFCLKKQIVYHPRSFIIFFKKTSFSKQMKILIENGQRL